MQELNASQNASVGLACGTIEVCIDQPMLYWKNAAQQNMPFTLNPRLMYRGLLASIANMASLTAIQFFGTGMIKQLIVDGEDRALTEVEEIASAFTGGAISGIVCGPLELTMIQQQRFGRNIIHTPMQIIRETGLLGMGRGMLPSIMREGIFTCGYLGVTPVLERKISQNEQLSFLPKPLVQFVCSMTAGFVASGLSHPADTIKTCMQGDIQQSTYTRMTSGLRLIIHRDGFGGLYKGFIWRYLRMGMTFFIFNLTMSPVSHVLFPSAFHDAHDQGDEALLFETQ
mmetsp:Transcript_18/g.27  ORF Transcript_18/g.27 Transcript_18/m.27 type:complete len:285 (-) Transcript_18:168-1022(-)|eukprot:CAMPEP_0197058114 /NCGR_PEP_ID=MMETSP1384-20130603/104225_1 /TAXON_ID=29189 /ORGANISM="Ammonia sp." /LENGTH=284 /DNA_ID=CAMNT_0042492751 /DNA_START=96 /DNA_END=950 /DNA_ORIENTATION=+